jgi:hypothetical protein
VNFPKHNGWSNEATWSIFTNFNRFEETRVQLRQRAQEGEKQVRLFVELLLHSWYEGVVSDAQCEALQGLCQACIQSGMRYISWSYIFDALRGEAVPRPPNELTRRAYEVLSTQNWREIVEGARHERTADTMLSNWFEKHCLIWSSIADGRKLRGPVSKFTVAVMDIYLHAANWAEVTAALRGE